MVTELVQSIELCVRSAQTILTTYRSYQNADEEIGEKIILLEAHWTKLEVQLQVLSGIADQLDEKVAENQFRVLQVLHGKLSHATSSIQMPESSLLRRLRYSMIKTRLNELVSELETWQTRFDPTWYLIILMSRGNICHVMRLIVN